jgi:hypothetical protein
MPEEVIGKLIVNKYELIYNNIKWKTGVVFYLKDQNTYAEICEKRKERKITITLCGERVKDLLNILLDELEKINTHGVRSCNQAFDHRSGS